MTLLIDPRFAYAKPSPSAIALCAALALTACGGGSTPEPMVATLIDEWSQSAPTETQTAVARDLAAYNAAWTLQLGNRLPVAPPQAVDFSQHAVVGLWLGTRPSGCAAVRVDEVVDTGSRIEVRYFERRPAPLEACTAVVTKPGLVVRVPHRNLPVVAVPVTCQSNCSR